MVCKRGYAAAVHELPEKLSRTGWIVHRPERLNHKSSATHHVAVVNPMPGNSLEPSGTPKKQKTYLIMLCRERFDLG
jgi:hypothetical protein